MGGIKKERLRMGIMMAETKICLYKNDRIIRRKRELKVDRIVDTYDVHMIIIIVVDTYDVHIIMMIRMTICDNSPEDDHNDIHHSSDDDNYNER